MFLDVLGFFGSSVTSCTSFEANVATGFDYNVAGSSVCICPDGTDVRTTSYGGYRETCAMRVTDFGYF